MANVGTVATGGRCAGDRCEYRRRLDSLVSSVSYALVRRPVRLSNAAETPADKSLFRIVLLWIISTDLQLLVSKKVVSLY